MVYFIRFFKVPKVYEDANKAPSVFAVITIQNDLGDLFLSSAIEVEAKLFLSSNNDINEATPYTHQTQPWRAGDRSMKIEIKTRKKPAALRLHVAAKSKNDKPTGTVPPIVSAWSATFGWGSETSRQAETLLERRFPLPGESSGTLNIWEETGNSIACHIWDAALGLLLLFQTLSHEPESATPMPHLLDHLNSLSRGALAQRAGTVLELGSGCGLAGLALSKTWRLPNVLLTDQPEAASILRRNIATACPAADDDDRIRHRSLAWGSPNAVADLDLDLDLERADLVLVSDCTYNPDSAPDLVQTLGHIAARSPQVKVLVGMKRRHASEAVFFDLMREGGFVVVERSTVMLPGISGDELEHTSVEIYLFGYKQ